MLVEYFLKVSGSVQGVGFRFFVQKLALEHHLVGYVKNLSDGSVEICVQGKQASLASLLEEVKKPRGLILVENLSVEKRKPSSAFVSFEILKTI